jgi:hypothetical protein
VEFANRAAQNGTLAADCLVTQLYRYAIRRMDAGADEPTLTSLTSKFKDGQSIRQLLAALTQTEPFLNRMNAQ